MKIVDCFWEHKNLNCNVAEVHVELNDTFDSQSMEQMTTKYEYTVVKVPMNMFEFNFKLSQMGFTLVENQLNISKKIKDFNFNLIQDIKDKLSFKNVEVESDLDDVVGSITEGMFSTDRIAIDRHFGPEKSMIRYRNWILSDYHSKASNITKVFYCSEEVGFMMFKIQKGEFKLLLNGLYKKWQGKHLGIITPSSPFLYRDLSEEPFEVVSTSISSNNVRVVKLYNKLNFELDNQNYVFVKHHHN